MLNELLSPSATEEARTELRRYNVSIPMGSLAIGVDNIHHDVFFSPRFVQGARDYLFDVIRQSTSSTYLPGIELRASRGSDSASFRKLLSELLQSSLTQAKYHKNIEIDLLFRLGLLKFLTFEIGNQFANLILEGKEWIRKRGEHFERSQQAHVIKARLSELQSGRREVIRRVGQQVAQIVADVEDNVVAKARRALFGEDFASYYELCKNRLIFLDGGKDDVFFLEHYILLGNYVRDPDRFAAMDTLFQEFLREAGVTLSPDPAQTDAMESHTTLLEGVQAIRAEIGNLEEQRENTRKRLDRGDGFFTKFLSSGDPANLKASLNDVELRLKHQEYKLEELGPQIDAARQKLDFFVKDRAGRLGEYLNEPENAKRLFDANSAGEAEAPVRSRLLSRLLDRLEHQEILYHILASYEIRPLASEYCPPGFERRAEASRAGHQAGAREEIVAQGYRGTVQENTPLLSRGKAGFRASIRQRLSSAEKGSAGRRTSDHLHGARQPGYHRKSPRTFALEQPAVRVRASRGSPAGAGPRGLARDHQVGRARVHAHDPGFALART